MVGEMSRTAEIRSRQQQDLARRRNVIAKDEFERRQQRLAHDAARKVKGVKTFRPIRPNKGLEVAYRKSIERLVDTMNTSVLYWLSTAFNRNEPELNSLLAKDSTMVEVEPRQPPPLLGLEGPVCSPSLPASDWSLPIFAGTVAQDVSPANILRRVVRNLARRWQRRFNETSLELARWFSQRAYARSQTQLQNILKKGGWTVDLKMTPAQRDILSAIINENVSLIRSIPQQYFTEIEGMVMRSVVAGRDLQQLTNDLQRRYRVTRKRAVLIARDQNNKATGALTRARQVELGITKAIWIHSGAGKQPRPTHVRNNGKTYDVKTGWYDPNEKKYIFPGELINCRCVSRSVIPGFAP